jgi:hypothetical protein
MQDSYQQTGFIISSDDVIYDAVFYDIPIKVQKIDWMRIVLNIVLISAYLMSIWMYNISVLDLIPDISAGGLSTHSIQMFNRVFALCKADDIVFGFVMGLAYIRIRSVIT